MGKQKCSARSRSALQMCRAIERADAACIFKILQCSNRFSCFQRRKGLPGKRQFKISDYKADSQNCVRSIDITCSSGSYFRLRAPGLTVSGGIHIAVLQIDNETNQVKILRYIDVEDSGKMINPDIVEGQLHGGITQGIASLLFEGLQYSEEGQLLTNSFMEYLVPTAREIPNFEIIHLDSPTNLNPFGIKGIGESGIVGPSAALSNALRRSEAAMKVNSTPFFENNKQRIEESG